MNDETIVAVYDTPAHAELAVQDLLAAAIPEAAISRHAVADEAATGVVAPPAREQGYWSSLFGGEPDHGAALYERSIASGSTVVTVRVSGPEAALALRLLESHQPVDLDERASSYGLAEAADLDRPNDGGTIALSAERMVVGKRLVNRGTTRVRRFVVETPAEARVTLRDERVVVERHQVAGARAATDADFDEKAVEMTATSEEAVVGKTARIVEEVTIRKEATDRVETVRDTVRHEDVAVEPAGRPSPKVQ